MAAIIFFVSNHSCSNHTHGEGSALWVHSLNFSFKKTNTKLHNKHWPLSRHQAVPTKNMVYRQAIIVTTGKNCNKIIYNYIVCTKYLTNKMNFRINKVDEILIWCKIPLFPNKSTCSDLNTGSYPHTISACG